MYMYIRWRGGNQKTALTNLHLVAHRIAYIVNLHGSNALYYKKKVYIKTYLLVYQKNFSPYFLSLVDILMYSIGYCLI